MKLVALECPKCNAPLEINSELTYATCNYCGCHFIIEDELRQKKMNSEDAYKMGYEFERGRSERQVDECRNLADKVKGLIKPVLDLQTKKSELEMLSIQINNLKAQEDAMASLNGKAKPYKSSLCIFICTILLAAIGGGIGVFVIGLVATMISFYVARFKRSKQQSELSELIQQRTEKYNETKNEILFITNKYDVNFIPQKYCYEEAMKYICEVLYNQRAMNISQAINLYEDAKHKMRMEQLQREQIAIQKRQQEQSSENDIEKLVESGARLGTLLKAGGVLLVAAFIKALDDE